VVAPPNGLTQPLVGFVLQLVIFTVTLSLVEEIGWRGYLTPRLVTLGRTRGLIMTGLVWAAWHLPLMVLTPLYHADGSRGITIPLFVATVVATSVLFGYLRLWTGSVWPAAIAHTVHNAAWTTFAAFTATSSPTLVNEYLVGDYGILILLGTVLVAAGLGRWLPRPVSEARTTVPSHEDAMGTATGRN
jgi:membrane protease YdiL (CAAX protease family)